MQNNKWLGNATGESMTVCADVYHGKYQLLQKLPTNIVAIHPEQYAGFECDFVGYDQHSNRYPFTLVQVHGKDNEIKQTALITDIINLKELITNSGLDRETKAQLLESIEQGCCLEEMKQIIKKLAKL